MGPNIGDDTPRPPGRTRSSPRWGLIADKDAPRKQRHTAFESQHAALPGSGETTRFVHGEVVHCRWIPASGVVINAITSSTKTGVGALLTVQPTGRPWRTVRERVLGSCSAAARCAGEWPMRADVLGGVSRETHRWCCRYSNWTWQILSSDGEGTCFDPGPRPRVASHSSFALSWRDGLGL